MSLRVAEVLVAGFLWLVFIPTWSRAQPIVDGAKKEGRVEPATMNISRLTEK